MKEAFYEEKTCLETYAYARAGLIGNPSDGFFGKTISIIVGNFRARVVCYPSANLQVRESAIDTPVFRSLDEVKERVKLHGYYGGIRLIVALFKRFKEYADDHGIELPNRNCTIEYESDIPARVGLAGSSAIVTAGLRALMAHYGVSIPKQDQANLILSVERDELGIGAGLQDRVIQVYQGVVYMDFNREHMQKKGHGIYEPIDPCHLPPVYIAYATDLAEGSEVFHNDIRSRFEKGEPKVVEAMERFGELAREAREALLGGHPEKLGDLMNANFDLRASLYQLRESDIDLVMRGRSVGASAKFAGSGGAVIGTYKDPQMLERLKSLYAEIGAKVIVPKIVSS